jgi:hypothetical protein
MQQPEQFTVVFTAKEILDQIHRELITHGADFTKVSLEQWKQYILARAIEDVLMVDLTPQFDRELEHMATLVRSNYRRQDGEEFITLNEDVGSNKLFPYLGSRDLSFESKLDLYRHCVSIAPRAEPIEVR